MTTYYLSEPSSPAATEFPQYEFQIEASNSCVKLGRSLLKATMGSGKTRVGIIVEHKILQHLAQSKFKGTITPTLVVCSKAALYTWQKELDKWNPSSEVMLIAGAAPIRLHKWNMVVNGEFKGTHVLCGYDTVVRDLSEIPKYWTIIISDECKKIRNRRTQRYKAFKTLKSMKFLALEGTPIRNGPQDLWSILHFINPQKFRSYWSFVGSWCLVDDEGYGKEILGAKNVKNLREMLKGYVVSVKDSDADRYLPEKQRIPIYVSLEDCPEQLSLYEDLYEDSMATIFEELQSRVVLAPGILAKYMALRKVLCTPKLFSAKLDMGVGMRTVLDHIQDNDVEHTVIFSFFPSMFELMLPIIESRLGMPVCILRGGMSPKQVQEVIRGFNQQKGIMLCSISFAESFDLDQINTGYVLGMDWNADVNLQAEDRLRRLSSAHSRIQIYYIIHQGTIDERVLEVINRKHYEDRLVFKDSKVEAEVSEVEIT